MLPLWNSSSYSQHQPVCSLSNKIWGAECKIDHHSAFTWAELNSTESSNNLELEERNRWMCGACRVSLFDCLTHTGDCRRAALALHRDRLPLDRLQLRLNPWTNSHCCVGAAGSCQGWGSPGNWWDPGHGLSTCSASTEHFHPCAEGCKHIPAFWLNSGWELCFTLWLIPFKLTIT